jgi:hypothetical protein
MPGNESGASGQRAVGRTQQRKRPQDYTGQEKLKGERGRAEQIEEAAERMAMADGPITVLRNSDPVDYTDEARRNAAPPVPLQDDPQVEVKPRRYKVRVVCDIEQMTFRREILDPGDFDYRGRLNEGVDPALARMPLLGGLNYYDFEEGKEYIVDEPLYQHLRLLGFIYE